MDCKTKMVQVEEMTHTQFKRRLDKLMDEIVELRPEQQEELHDDLKKEEDDPGYLASIYVGDIYLKDLYEDLHEFLDDCDEDQRDEFWFCIRSLFKTLQVGCYMKALPDKPSRK